MSPGLPTSIQAGSRLESYSFLRSIYSPTSDIVKQNNGKGRVLRNNRLEAPVKSNQNLIKECFPSLGERNQTVLVSWASRLLWTSNCCLLSILPHFRWEYLSWTSYACPHHYILGGWRIEEDRRFRVSIVHRPRVPEDIPVNWA